MIPGIGGSTKHLLAATALVAMAAIGAAATPVSPSDWTIDYRKITREVGDADRVSIVNEWGSVQVRAEGGGELIVSSAVQHHRDDPRQPTVVVRDTAQGLVVEIGFEPSTEDPVPDAWAGRRIDIGVLVPTSMELEVRTVDDAIEVRDLAGPAVLESVTGEIRFKGLGGLRATTGSGSIFAQLRRSGWPEPVVLTTSTGDIRAELLEGAAASVHLETRGPITTDYTITVERSPGSMLKRAVAEIGGGGQTLRATSVSGAVTLAAVIVPEQTAD